MSPTGSRPSGEKHGVSALETDVHVQAGTGTTATREGAQSKTVRNVGAS